jgi:hypothetical protein
VLEVRTKPTLIQLIGFILIIRVKNGLQIYGFGMALEMDIGEKIL